MTRESSSSDVAGAVKLLEDILTAMDSFSHRPLFFRGHAAEKWPLKPALGRIDRDDDELLEQELTAFKEFVGRAGAMSPDHEGPWATAITMQHHGLPTRLLDWTETFAVALHFALREDQGDAAIWVLDPAELNRQSLGRDHLVGPTDLPGTYHDYFLTGRKNLPGVVALAPLRRQPRVFAQRSGFTLHGNLRKTLDELHPGAVRKIVIPASRRASAMALLELTGVSEFALFPDLDGLAREVRSLLRW